MKFALPIADHIKAKAATLGLSESATLAIVMDARAVDHETADKLLAEAAEIMSLFRVAHGLEAHYDIEAVREEMLRSRLSRKAVADSIISKMYEHRGEDIRTARTKPTIAASLNQRAEATFAERSDNQKGNA